MVRDNFKILVKTKSGNHYYINNVQTIVMSEHFILLKTVDSSSFNRSISKEKLLSIVCSIPGFRS